MRILKTRLKWARGVLAFAVATTIGGCDTWWRVSGTVVEDDGARPLEGVDVELVCGFQRWKETTTGWGSFVFSSLGPEMPRPCTLGFSKSGYAPLQIPADDACVFERGRSGCNGKEECDPRTKFVDLEKSGTPSIDGGTPEVDWHDRR
jgi:hypothetical protein